jgi:hypothetical protein
MDKHWEHLALVRQLSNCHIIAIHSDYSEDATPELERLCTTSQILSFGRICLPHLSLARNRLTTTHGLAGFPRLDRTGFFSDGLTPGRTPQLPRRRTIIEPGV